MGLLRSLKGYSIADHRGTRVVSAPVAFSRTLEGFDLWDHQRRAVEKLHERSGLAALLMDMRTGKTRTALAYAYQAWAERTLVICPLNVMRFWRNEALRTPIGQIMDVLMLDNSTSIKKRAELLLALTAKDGIVIVNHEACWREPLRSAILRWAPDAVLVDEAQRIKHRQARQTKFIHQLGDKEYVRIKIPMTGTPMTKGLQNIWSIYRFMDPSIFGDRWNYFQNRYLIMGGFEMREVKGHQNTEEAEELIAKSSFRITRDECFDLPPRSDEPVAVPLNISSIATYKKMKKEYIVQVDGTMTGGTSVSGTAFARIVLTATLRLQQITSGFIKLDTDEEVDTSTEKLDTCVEFVKDALENGEKIAVFCRFRRDIARVFDALKVAGISADVFMGGMTPLQRQSVFDDEGKWRALNPVIVAQTRAISLGLSVSAASIGIFFSQGFSLEDFKQAKDRLHGSDQTRAVSYYHLLATLNDQPSVDHEVYNVFDRDEEFAHSILRDPGIARRLLTA